MWPDELEDPDLYDDAMDLEEELRLALVEAHPAATPLEIEESLFDAMVTLASVESVPLRTRMVEPTVGEVLVAGQADALNSLASVDVMTGAGRREEQPVATDTSGLELFRLAALRPPKLVRGNMPRIRLEPGEEPVEAPPIVDSVTGELEDLPMVLHDLETAFPFRALDRTLAKRDDRWDPQGIAGWVHKRTGNPVKDFVADPVWVVHRGRVHAALTHAVSPEGATGDFSVPTAMLRACRLIGLVEGIAAQLAVLSGEEAVRRFLRFSTVQLPGSLTPTLPSPLARPPAIADLK